MTAIAGACAIGFGTRSWTGAPEHLAALELALDHGCSLIDVAWPRVAQHVEPAVGRALAHRLDGAVVIAGTADVGAGSLARRVRIAAGRLRRDRLDVLLLDDPARVLAEPDGERRFQQAVATLEILADRGELGCYGLRLGRAPISGEAIRGEPTAARTISRCLDLAGQVRADHRMSVLQAPCPVLRPAVRTQVPDLLAVARASRLSTVGTRPLPVWPVAGVAPMATCQRYLLEGLDHVVLDLRNPGQVRGMAAMLPGGTHRTGGSDSRRAC
jgi:hypothetical protein